MFLNSYAWTPGFCTADSVGPIAGTGALFGEREQMSPSPEETLVAVMAPSGCSHFDTTAPLAARQFRIGL